MTAVEGFEIIEHPHQYEIISRVGRSFVDRTKCQSVQNSVKPGRSGRLDEPFLCAMIGMLRACEKQIEEAAKKLRTAHERKTPTAPEELSRVRFLLVEATSMRVLVAQTIEQWQSTEKEIFLATGVQR